MYKCIIYFTIRILLLLNYRILQEYIKSLSSYFLIKKTETIYSVVQFII